MSNNIKILIFTGFYLPGYKGGGPIKTIKNLVEQANSSLSYKIITSDRDLGDKSPYSNIKHDCWNNLGNNQVFYAKEGLMGFRQIFKLLNKESYDIVYLNSFFSTKFSLFPLLVSIALRKQVVLGPRGEFSLGALNLKSTKKDVFIKAYKLLGLKKNTVFQASSKYEAEDIQKILGPNTNIFIAEDIGAQEFSKKITKRDRTTTAAFISRISPMKNLNLALEALKKVRGFLVYDIYGPIEDEDYWQKCQNTISSLPSNIRVEYKGELRPDQVISTLSAYDFFFMPTKGENYGHVIAEALCAGLPLVISNTTPWKNLESLGIGWDLPLDNLDEFSKVIDTLIDMSDDEHYKMRQAVLKWAKQKFAQRSAIESNIAMFHYAYNKKKGINNAVQR